MTDSGLAEDAQTQQAAREEDGLPGATLGWLKQIGIFKILAISGRVSGVLRMTEKYIQGIPDSRGVTRIEDIYGTLCSDFSKTKRGWSCRSGHMAVTQL